jgi:diaminohydroxyphosphoribosylaminopyrimidine deaminase/5-amino-6-(5-phosphoribosylamino)uracil reductase
VVAATLDPNPLVAGKGVKILQEAGIAVDVGALEADARALNPGFLRRIGGGLPWVRVKLAASLDGRTAMANGDSKWITGPEARRDVQRWRAMSSAIVTGVGTVLADDPSLTVRPDEWSDWRHGDVVAPWRVVLDKEFRTPPTAQLFRHPGRVIIAGVAAPLERQAALKDAGAELWLLPAGREGRVDLRALLKRLAEAGANEVLVEAGATVAGAFAREGLVDEVVLYTAPVVLGSAGRPLLEWPLQSMRDQRRFVVTDTRMVGNDTRTLLRPKTLGGS